MSVAHGTCFFMTNHSPQQPIGVFDSGIGGLTVVNAIVKHLPKEEIIYFGDTAHLPYGDKSADAIRYYCIRIVKFLLEKNCKMIVFACNSAASAAFRILVDFFQGQALFVNVVDPLIQTVAQQDFKKVGIIATKATIRSDVYRLKLLEKKPELQVHSLATPLLVPMIEEGYIQNNISDAIIANYLSQKGFQNIDALLLACTHYPLIKKNIISYFDEQVQVYDSTDVVAYQMREQLEQYQLLNDQKRQPHQFFVSDYTDSFEETTKLFYQEKIHLEQSNIW